MYQREPNFSFFPITFLNVGSSLLKCSVVIIDMPIEGAVSQILYLGPSLCFMQLQK